MHTVKVERRINGPRTAVWEAYTDHVSWNDWARIGKVRLAREGDTARNGVGCVRVISNPGVSVEEEVLSFTPPERMTYTVVKGGIPIKDHLGEVVFEDQGDGTLVRWNCRFNSKIPGLGWLWKLVVGKIFRDALGGLDRKFS